MVKKKQTVVLFGAEKDPQIQQSVKNIKRAGRRAKVEPPPSDTHSSGVGFDGSTFEGDKGASMGASY